jgi:hypothetical protein
MLSRVLAFFAAAVAGLVAIVAYYFIWQLLAPWDGQRLLASLLLVAVSVYFFRRARGLPTLLLLIGSIGLGVAHLHDYLLFFGIMHELFQVGGSDSYIMQGFFEPRENPLIAVPADVFRYIGLLAIIGFGWFVGRVAYKHLTRRCSEPLAAPRFRFR